MRRRHAGDSVRARSRRRYRVARAVHADGADAGARHCRRLGRRSSASRWRSARFSPGSSSDDPTTACAPRRKRCRCAMRSPCCSSWRSACCCRRPTFSKRPASSLATLAVVMIGKPLVALVIVRVLGYPFKVALAIAVALAQIGEFSFILSSIGTELGILPPEATNTLVAVVDRLDRSQSSSLSTGPARRELGRGAPAPVDAAESAPPRQGRRHACGPATADRFQPARRRRRIWPDRPHRRPAAARQRHRIGGDRAQYGDRAAASGERAPRQSTATRRSARRSRQRGPRMRGRSF